MSQIYRRRFIQAIVQIAAAVMGQVLLPRSAAASTLDWDYSGDLGPNHWGDFPDYALCATGQHQSPIDLDTLIPTTVDLRCDYHSSPLKLTNNGHTIRVDYARGSTLTLDGESFELLQFHFHDPSEHTHIGEHQPMEIHFVHRQLQTQRLAVLSVLIQAGTHNPALDPIWQQLPQRMGQSVARSRHMINATALLPDDIIHAFRYSGSLTTPPCSENVIWLIATNPISAAPAQIDQFVALIGPNARPTQPTSQSR